MVKKNKAKREISNRLLYTLITIGILAIIGVGVYAYGTSNPSYFGHSAGELSGVCLSNGTGCPVSNGSSQWTTSGSNVYYTTGNVGIGTNNPSSRLTVAGGASTFNGATSLNGPVALNGVITTNSSLTLGGVFPNLINGQAFSVWATNPGVNPGVFINNAFANGSLAGIGLLVGGAEGIRTNSNTLGVYGRSGGGIGVQGEGATFDFYASGAGTNYGSPSSIRWKKNIKPIDNALDIVLNLRGVSFDWDKAHGGEHDIGFIGEQVGQYIPEIVQFDSDSPKPNYYVTGIDYSKMTPVLLEAIKEQQKQIEDLKLEVEQLKNK